MVWHKREELSPSISRSNNWGLLVILAGMLLHVVATSGRAFYHENSHCPDYFGLSYTFSAGWSAVKSPSPSLPDVHDPHSRYHVEPVGFSHATLRL